MIILIDNYDSFTFNLYQMVALHTSQIKVIRHDQHTVAEILALQPTGIILSPGPGKPENAGVCISLVRALPRHLPLLGVCLGHQAIVAAFNVSIVPANNIIHGKSDLIFHDQQGLYKHLPQPFQAGRYHSLMARRENFCAELRIDAYTQDGTIMGVRHPDRPIFGVQFHPESVLTPQGNLLMQEFLNQC